MKVDNLILEATRYCNMSCEHCLRGNFEDKHMSNNILQHIFQNITDIDTLTISGGEPFQAGLFFYMNLINHLEYFKTNIENICIITNGKEIDPKYMEYIFRLHLIAPVKIYWSNDEFHEGLSWKDEKFIEFFNIKPLYLSKKEKIIINEGKAINISDKAYKKKLNKIPWIEFEDDTIYGQIYINVYGDIINDCDWSYESQRTRKEIKIGSILNDNFEEIILTKNNR